MSIKVMSRVTFYEKAFDKIFFYFPNDNPIFELSTKLRFLIAENGEGYRLQHQLFDSKI